MTSIIEVIMKNDEYMIITLLAMLVAIILTFIVNFAAKKLKFAKYLPGIVLICIGIVSLFSVISKLFDPNSLDSLIVFVISCGSGIVSLLFALIIGIIQNDLNWDL